jgi:hypothetical protein
MLRSVNDGVMSIKLGQRLVHYYRKSYVWRTPKETYNPECLVPIVKDGGGSVMVWAAISCYVILLVLLLPFMAKLLKGSKGTVWIIRCIP